MIHGNTEQRELLRRDGLGEKTAFHARKRAQRLLNLDSAYLQIIKPAVEAALLQVRTR
jgi:hypothetical protein